MSDLEQFGYFVRELREKAGLTQEELARRVRTSRPTITSIERGYRRYISTSLVIKLAAALEVPPGLLLAELGIKPSDAAQATWGPKIKTAIMKANRMPSVQPMIFSGMAEG